MSATDGEVELSECLLDAEEIEVGQTVTATVTIVNTSPVYDAEFTVQFLVAGDQVDSATDTLEAGQSGEYEFTATFEDAGGYDIDVERVNQQFIVEIYSSYGMADAETNEDGVVLRLIDSVSGIDATLN